MLFPPWILDSSIEHLLKQLFIYSVHIPAKLHGNISIHYFLMSILSRNSSFLFGTQFGAIQTSLFCKAVIKHSLTHSHQVNCQFFIAAFLIGTLKEENISWFPVFVLFCFKYWSTVKSSVFKSMLYFHQFSQVCWILLHWMLENRFLRSIRTF